MRALSPEHATISDVTLRIGLTQTWFQFRFGLHNGNVDPTHVP